MNYHDQLYFVTIECQGVRKQLVFEDVEEYQLWCCWIRDEKHFNGDGDTPAQAFHDMIDRMPGIKKQLEECGERVRSKTFA